MIRLTICKNHVMAVSKISSESILGIQHPVIYASIVSILCAIEGWEKRFLISQTAVVGDAIEM